MDTITLLIDYIGTRENGSTMNSYRMMDWADAKFGKDNIVDMTEIRDQAGYLLYIKLVVKTEIKNG